MSALVDDATRDMLSDLRQELLSLLALPTAFVGYFVLLLADLAFGIHSLVSPGIGACVIVASLCAQRLKGRRPRFAALVYVGGLTTAASAAVWASHSPLAMAVYPAVILLSMAMLGVRPMAVVSGLGGLVILASAWKHQQLGNAVLVPISVLLFTALVAWLSHRSLATATEWAWNSYRQARASTEEAREHRGELARTLKALDEAYYRLERFSTQLAQAREAAEEARRAKQQFVATVSHELRTPLNIIIGFAELITLSPESYGVRGVPRQFVGDVNRIYRSAQHLKGLIDDVLDLSQIDARHMFLVTEQAALTEVVGEAIDMIWSLATQKGLRLIVDMPGSLPPISLDRLRIRQVLLNLLSNAVHFTEKGQITVSARQEEQALRVTVADTGLGIAPEDLGRVFEEFHQLDQSLSRRHEGTGLGLALSRRFVELHGGRMWAEGELGRGSRFHFALPLAPAAERAGGGSTPRSLPLGIKARKGCVVLVASEEPMVVSLLKRHLRGYEVHGVPARELSQAIESELPHAVIANGPVTAVPLADQPSRALPVPLITCPLPDPTYLGHALGVDRYLVKPISREQLLGLLAGYGDTVQRVLIVDDDAQLAELMARIVRAAPRRYTVDVACGGTEGLARMQERRPDIVLLDLVMKDMDGLTLLQAMRAQERLRAVSVAIITAHDLPNEVARLPGRSITLQGPESFSVTEVLDCVQALLDVLPPPKPASSPPPRPRAGLPAPPVS